MSNEQDWLDGMYEQLTPYIKATSLGDDDMGCLVSMEWSDKGLGDRLVEDVEEQVPERRHLVHLLVAATMQYALERASREADEERQRGLV